MWIIRTDAELAVKKVCHDVRNKPVLLIPTNTENHLHSDISRILRRIWWGTIVGGSGPGWAEEMLTKNGPVWAWPVYHWVRPGHKTVW